MKLHRLASGVTAKFDLALELFDEGDAGMLGKLIIRPTIIILP